MTHLQPQLLGATRCSCNKTKILEQPLFYRCEPVCESQLGYISIDVLLSATARHLISMPKMMLVQILRCVAVFTCLGSKSVSCLHLRLKLQRSTAINSMSESKFRNAGMAAQSACICASTLRATPAVHNLDSTFGHCGADCNLNRS